MTDISEPTWPEPVLDAAATWLARTHDDRFEDWDGFTVWLEADPAHADAYHALADSVIELTPAVAAVPAPSAPPAETRTRWPWAVAAGVAAFGALGLTVLPALGGTTYSTRPGEIRTIALADGDELVLNGGTEVRLAAFDRRDIRLERGQLLLRLNGDKNDAVAVRAGDLELVDVGTVFEVARDGASTRVSVSEGAVVADPDGAAVRLNPGQKLETVDGATVLKAEAALAESVGAFRRGQLTYLDGTVAAVVADLSRSTGIDFSVGSAMGQRRFTGTLSVAEVKRDPASLGPLLGVPIARAGQGWRLGEGP